MKFLCLFGLLFIFISIVLFLFKYCDFIFFVFVYFFSLGLCMNLMFENNLFKDLLEIFFFLRLNYFFVYFLGSRSKVGLERFILFLRRKRRILINYYFFFIVVWMMEVCWRFIVLIYVCYKLCYIFIFFKLEDKFIVNIILWVGIYLFCKRK